MGSEITLILMVVGGIILGPSIIISLVLSSKINRLRDHIHELSSSQDDLRTKFISLKNRFAEFENRSKSSTPPESAVATPPVAASEVKQPPPVPEPPIIKVEQPEPVSPVVPEKAAPASIPPPVFHAESIESSTPQPPPAISKPVKLPTIDLEKFMGVKLFAWVGGLALFLGIAFFVKYSFENNLVRPEIRIAIGYLAGIGLLVGGLYTSRKNYLVMMQSLCATGILVLYGVTFGAHSLYHFIPPIPTFGLMVLITFVAFLLAARFEAPVVAVLGLVGGFLTPLLLSTGKDNPVGLFSYIAILDLGLIAVAYYKRWNYLVLMATIGTLIMQIGWAMKFFAAPKIYTAMIVIVGFEILFLISLYLFRRKDAHDKLITSSSVLIPFFGIFFGWYLLSIPEIAKEPMKVFVFLLAADLGLAAVAWLCPRFNPLHNLAGGFVFLLLSIWTYDYLSNPLLNYGLGAFFVFAVLHAAFPVVLQRRHPELISTKWSHAFPCFALILILLHIFRATDVPVVTWIGVLLINGLTLALAILTSSLISILIVLLLTMGALGAWMFQIPTAAINLTEMLLLTAGFAIFFFAGGVFLSKRKSFATTIGTTNEVLAIPSLGTILPFVLLMMIVMNLKLPNPSPIFGLALLLVVLLLGLSHFAKIDSIVIVSFICMLGLEFMWHQHHFNRLQPVIPLLWYLCFYAVFALFPFISQKKDVQRIIPWSVAALSAPLHFYLFYQLMDRAYPNSYMGLLPAVFALPSLISVAYLATHIPTDHQHRNTLFAWFGGTALFFITLIFPIQFSKEWWTIGWAMEGAALIWLIRRVPHPGLKWVGAGLLIAAFVRLTLNPTVLSYHPRSSTPIWNWYLYTYGLVIVCLFLGSYLLDKVDPKDTRSKAILNSLGAILAFLLMNIEIADYFSTGSSLTFQFSGNFARDMTYSISWALFALGLLVVGMLKNISAARYAGIVLLTLTLIKLFFHDLSQLSQLYRIGAFIGVAIILMLASFFYQRFLSTQETKND